MFATAFTQWLVRWVSWGISWSIFPDTTQMFELIGLVTVLVTVPNKLVSRVLTITRQSLPYDSKPQSLVQLLVSRPGIEFKTRLDSYITWLWPFVANRSISGSFAKNWQTVHLFFCSVPVMDQKCSITPLGVQPARAFTISHIWQDFPKLFDSG